MMKEYIRYLYSAVISAIGAVIVFSGGSVPVYAEESNSEMYGEQADSVAKGKIQVTGVVNTDGTSVKAYQVVDGYYDDGCLVKYVLMDPVNGSIKDLEHPTADEILTIAQNIRQGTFTADSNPVSLSYDESSGFYVGEAEPGLYVVMVSGSGFVVYNPGVISVNITNANAPVKSAETDPLDMTSYFSDGSKQVYLKSTSNDSDSSDSTTSSTVSASSTEAETVTDTLPAENPEEDATTVTVADGEKSSGMQTGDFSNTEFYVAIAAAGFLLLALALRKKKSDDSKS